MLRVNKVVSGILIVSFLISHLITIANAGTVFSFGYTITASGTQNINIYPDQSFSWTVTGSGTETWTEVEIDLVWVSGRAYVSGDESPFSYVAGAGHLVHMSFIPTASGRASYSGRMDNPHIFEIGANYYLPAFFYIDSSRYYDLRYRDADIVDIESEYQGGTVGSFSGTFNVVAGHEYYISAWVDWYRYYENEVTFKVWYPVSETVTRTATRTATDTGWGMVNQTEGSKHIGSFSAYPQPQQGGTISGVSYSINDDNPNVNTWTSGTSVYASTSYSEIQSIPWVPSSETGSSSVNTDDGDTYIGTSTLVAPNGDTVWSVVDDSDVVNTWMVGSAMYGRADPVPPTVVTNAETAVTAYSATLNGNLNGLGTASPVQVSFEWGLTPSYGFETTPQDVYATGPFNSGLSGLAPNTTYHFRAKAVGDRGSYGSDIIFTTTPLYDLVMQFTGSGSTTPSTGSHQYAEGTVVNISATPSPGWQFDSWTGDVANPSSPTTSVTVDSSKTVTANFSQIMHTLTMQVIGCGTSTPIVGDHDYAQGTVVDISADNWTGDVANPASAITTVTVDAGKTLTANFSQIMHTLTMQVSGSGSTTPAVGAYQYAEGTVVDITATPSAGWQFDVWTGDVANPGSPNTTVTMDTSKTLTANFSEAVVTFPDPNLEAAIREAIGKPTGDIYQSDLAGLISLDASNRGIVDLTGMEFCTSLIELRLHNNEISDLSPLSDLTGLTLLYLYQNQISEISPLSNLTGLTILILNSNQISDVSPLSNLASLTSLNVAYNNLTNISPVSNLTNLTWLRLENNQISDITPLSSLTVYL